MRRDLSFSNLQHCNSFFFLLFFFHKSAQCNSRGFTVSFQTHHCFWFKSFRAGQSEEIHGNRDLSHGSQTLKLESSAHISLWNFSLSNYISSAIVVVSLTIYSLIPRIKKIHLSRYCTVRRIKGSLVSRKFKKIVLLKDMNYILIFSTLVFQK